MIEKIGEGLLYAISFANFNSFVDELVKSSDVYGPIKKKVSSYEKLNSSKELFFETLPEYTAKGLFFKPKEMILGIDNGKIIVPKFLKEEQKRKVLLGLRLCELAAINKQDTAFGKGVGGADPYYKKRRSNTLLFGYHQKECGDKWCFCQSVDLDYSFDLMFYKRVDHYLIEVGTQAGLNVIKEFGKYFDNSSYVLTSEDKKIENQLKLDSLQIDSIYENQLWQTLSDECLSCGVCNALCPTCYCFEFKESKISSNVKKGKSGGDKFEKTRWPSECQLEAFTRVAGGHIFRSKKIDKFKHRIYHQLKYFKDKTGKTLCVGCGRCIRHCPTKIDFVSGINKMLKENLLKKEEK